METKKAPKFNSFLKDFLVPSILPKNKQKNLTHDTSGQLIFLHFLEEFEETKKAFRN
jgi:hypothetical protein